MPKTISSPLAFLAAVAFVAFSAHAAGRNTELNTRHHFPTRAEFARSAAGGGGGSNLSYHGGGTITSAHVVTIFWGPEWSSSGVDYNTAQHIIGFFGQYGTTGEYNVITQYYNTTSGSTQYIQTTSMGNLSWNDTTEPPNNVTDADMQAEVVKCLNGGHCGTFDPSAIYEVFLPASNGSGAVYSSDGTSTSCGGPNLKYCAYHGHFSGNGYSDVKYSSMPYPSCSGCQSSGFTDAQNFDHFSSHETREAVTDEDGNAWYDRRGYEADDKCAWSPAPFIDSTTGYAYQYEWSNQAAACVQTK